MLRAVQQIASSFICSLCNTDLHNYLDFITIRLRERINGIITYIMNEFN